MKRILLLLSAFLIFTCSSSNDDNNSNNFSLNFNQAFIEQSCLYCEDEFTITLFTSGLEIVVVNNVGEPIGTGEILQFDVVLTEDVTGTYTFTGANPTEPGQLTGGLFVDNYDGEGGIGLANQYEFNTGSITIIDNGNDTITINYSVDLYDINDFESAGSISGTYTGGIEYLEILL